MGIVVVVEVWSKDRTKCFRRCIVKILGLLSHTVLTSLSEATFYTSLTRALVATCKVGPLTGVTSSPGLLSPRPMWVLGVVLLLDLCGALLAGIGGHLVVNHLVVFVFMVRIVLVVLRHAIRDFTFVGLRIVRHVVPGSTGLSIYMRVDVYMSSLVAVDSAQGLVWVQALGGWYSHTWFAA